MAGNKKERQGPERATSSDVDNSSVLSELSSPGVTRGVPSNAPCLRARIPEIRDARGALMWLPGDVGDALLTFWLSPWAGPGAEPNR